MKKILFQTLTIIFLINLISGCTMSKRRYMRGYDISFHKHKKGTDNIQSEKTTQSQSKTDTLTESLNPTIELDESMVATIDSKFDIKLLAKRENSILKDNECDNIILKNGNEIKCKVLEIGTSEIKYKKCDNPNGPTYSINKHDVLTIQYANGTKDIMPQQENNNSNVSNNSNARNHPLAVWSLVCGLVGWVVFFVGIPLSIIFGAIALNKIKNNPEKYKGKGMALAGLIIGIVAIGIILLLLL